MADNQPEPANGPRETAVEEPPVIPLTSTPGPKNLDAYTADAVLPTAVEFDEVDAAPGKPPGKLGTFAAWARNVSTGKRWVMDLNIITTNRCTQTCPMCNSYVLAQTNRAMMTADQFRGYLAKLERYRIPSCTISGGEPTTVPDMPEILIDAQRSFPYGVTLISNFYGNTKRIMRVMDAALKVGVRISCSFDGFGDVANKQRGARNVSDHVLAHLKLVIERRRQLGSKSSITLHTVLSDDNVGQYPQILDLVKELGIRHTVAPFNPFGYDAANLSEGEAMPTNLTPSPELERAVELALEHPNLVQSHAFVRGIVPYITGEGYEKICPYLTPGLKSLKLFLEPNGDISLCDRQPIGNLNTHTLEQVFQTDAYQRTVEQSLKPCPGCWLSCFVEMPLSIKPGTLARLDFLHRKAPAGL